ncbi:MAG: Smr/MutS family protein [Gammaproteobacteria bacterium]|nr:Smr/MutS family protein [Gammaproteobacteria bacterium]
MAESKDISRQDIELFRQAIGEVDKIEHDGAELPAPKPSPVPNQTIISEQNSLNQMANNPFDIPDIETGDELYFRRSGVQQQIMRKLRRGQFAIESELDLHGMTVSVAKKELKDFLVYCQSTNRRCIRIIHGKGHGSVDKIPVLKNKLNKWLQNFDSILAFCSAPTHDGGTGAIYALINKY